MASYATLSHFRENSITRFPKTYRLHHAAEFSSVIRFRCSVYGKFLHVFARPNGLPHPRLGLIVAGKIERLAVNRNKVKRALREVFRTVQRDLAGVDLVVRLRCAVEPGSLSRMTDEARRLMGELHRCHA